MISQYWLYFSIHTWLPKGGFFGLVLFCGFFSPWSLNLSDALGSHCYGCGAELVLGLCWLLQAKKLVCFLTSGQLRSSSEIPDTETSSGLKSWELGTNVQWEADSPCTLRSCCLFCTGDLRPYGCSTAVQPWSSLLLACAQSLLLLGSCCAGMRGKPSVCLVQARLVSILVRVFPLSPCLVVQGRISGPQPQGAQQSCCFSLPALTARFTQERS